MLKRFGQWRSLVHQTPSFDHWAILCEHLQAHQWDESARDVLLPYLHGALHHWDDRICAVPRVWLELLADDQDVPYLTLARTLFYDASRARPHFWADVCHQFNGLTQLYMDSCAIDTVHIAMMMDSNLPDTLKVLNLWNNRLDDRSMAVLCQAERWRALKVLNLGYNRYITAESLALLAQMPWLKQLHHLQLNGTRIGPKAMADFAHRWGDSIETFIGS